jgi:hypothetical protein
MKKEVKKPAVKAVKAKVKKPVEHTPIIIETIRSTEKVEVRPVFEKQVIENIPIPTDSVRVIVLQDYKGMLNDLYVGDIIDMPERRYKTLSFRGLVKIYEGPKMPNKQR